MELPFLPVDDKSPMFSRLRLQATTPQLEDLINYMEHTWINSIIWSPSSWSIYMLPVQTNNDIKGWHHSLNCRANGKVNLPFYLLVELLHQEARLVSIQIRLVSEGKLSRIQRKNYRLLQAKLFKFWEDHSNGDLSARRLLKLCS